MSARRTLTLIMSSAVLVACGSDDTLSAEDYRAQGNAACAQYEKDVRAIAQPSDVDDVGAFAADAQVQLDELVEELDELAPPDDLEQKHNELIRLGRQSSDALGDLAEAGETGKADEVRKELAAAEELDVQTDELSRTLGLDECAEES